MNQPLSVSHHRPERWGLAAILILFTALALLYDAFVPLFEKPDELKHFAVVQYIHNQHRLPVVRAGETQPYDQEGTQPPLYHLLSAAATAWLNLADFAEPPRNPHYADDRSFVWRERGNNNLYLHPPGENWHWEAVTVAARLARWVSLLAGIGTIFLTYKLAQIIWSYRQYPGPDTGQSLFSGLTIYRWLPLWAAALAAFVPQFLHVSSAITNDSLSVTLAALALLLLALIIQRGATLKLVGGLGVTLALGAITKLSLLYLYPLAALVLLLNFSRRRSIGELAKYGFTLGAAGLLLAGWWYWRNWQLYGDVSALAAHLLYRGGALDPRPTLAQIWQTEMTGLELTFWAAFGAGQVLIAPWLVEALRWLKYLILVGLALGGWQLAGQIRAEAKTRPQLAGPAKTEALILGLLALWCVIIFVALLRWMQITPASWGRLLFPALPALAVLSAWGLAQFALLARRWGESAVAGFIKVVAGLIPWLAGLGLFALALASPFVYLRAAYAPTPLITAAELPPNITRLDWRYGDESLRLVGYRLERPSVRPGEWLPVTLYWQATQPITKNYSAFIHLLNLNGSSIAQSNSYPDGGRRPTSQLEPGLILPDTVYVFVPPTADAPVATRLAFGIFEFDDPQRAAKPAIDVAGAPVEPIVPGVPLLPLQWPTLAPAEPLTANFGDQIQLAGYDWVNQPVHPGQSVPLTFYWRTLSPPQRDLTLFIQLVEPDSQAQVAGFDGPPQFPTGLWPAGSTFIDRRTLAFPGNVPPGRYNLLIGWYNLEDFARLPLNPPQPADALKLLTVTVE